MYKSDFAFVNDYYDAGIGGYYDKEKHFAIFSTESLKEEQCSISIIHEIVHAAGISDYSAEFITEGFTEAITEKIAQEVLVGPYESYKSIAQQLLEIDDQIIKGYLTQENFSVIEKIDQLANAEIGVTLEKCSTIYMSGNKTDTMELYMQYIAGEIIKQYSDNALEIAEKYPVDVFLFGIRSLFV